MNTNNTYYVAVGRTPRRYDGRVGWSVFYSNFLVLVVLLSGIDDSHWVGSLFTLSK